MSVINSYKVSYIVALKINKQSTYRLLQRHHGRKSWTAVCFLAGTASADPQNLYKTMLMLSNVSDSLLLNNF